MNVADFFKSSCSATSHFDVGLILYFLQCRYKNKNFMMRTVNSAFKWAWNNSHAFMVLNDDAEHSDETGGGKMECASI